MSDEKATSQRCECFGVSAFLMLATIIVGSALTGKFQTQDLPQLAQQNKSRPFPSAEAVLDKTGNLSKISPFVSGVAAVECVTTGAYFPLSKELVLRGARLVHAPINAFYTVGSKCCGRRQCGVGRKILGRHNRHCPRHMAWIQKNVFDKCPACKWFYFAPSCGKMWATAALMRRTQRIIIGSMMKVEWCQGDEYDSSNGIEIAKADILLVLSGRSKYVCPQIAEKMLIAGETRFPRSRAEIESQSALIDKRWERERERERESESRKGAYIVTVGNSHRDHYLVLRAVRQLSKNVTVKIISAAPSRWCTRDVFCERLRLSPDDYIRTLSEALFVAIPVSYGKTCALGKQCGLTGAGITSLSESINLGKIVVMTDAKAHLTDGYIHNGTTGFLLEQGDLLGWTRVFKYLIEASPSVLHAMEQRALNMTRNFSWESLAERLLDKIFERSARLQP